MGEKTIKKYSALADLLLKLLSFFWPKLKKRKK